MELKDWFRLGPPVEEPIRYNPKTGKYIEKVIPTVIMVWWIYVLIGLGIFLTGLTMAFPTTFGFVFTLLGWVGKPLVGMGGYVLTRALHRLLMYLLVLVFLLHVYAAFVFKMVHSITLGDREEPILE